MAKQLANDGKPESRANPNTRVSVPQIVDAHVHEAGPLPYSVPRPVEVCARPLGIAARDHKSTETRKAGKQTSATSLPTAAASRA
jgi:hypothetical protein